MTSFLASFVVGSFEDQVGLLVWGWWAKNFARLGGVNQLVNPLVGAPFGGRVDNYWGSTQPLLWGPLSWGLARFNPLAFFNIISLLGVLLTFVFSYLLFKKIIRLAGLAVPLAIIFTLSPFTWLHFGRHIDLTQVWVLPLFLLILLTAEERKTWRWWVLTGLTLGSSVLISNYLGFFLILFFASWATLKTMIACPSRPGGGLLGWIKSRFAEGRTGGELIPRRSSFRIPSVLRTAATLFRGYLLAARNYLLVFLVAGGMVAWVLLPHLKVNLFNRTSSVPGFGSYPVVVMRRSLEDFQNFSARPWYYLLPPLKNPRLGGVTGPVLDWLENDWGYFLADDYFPWEHGANYLGWANLLVFAYAWYWVIRSVKVERGKNRLKLRVKEGTFKREELWTILTFSLLVLTLFLFSLPPFFTFSGLTIYTPGWLIYKFFPMFRVTARLGVLILLGVLVVVGCGLLAVRRRLVARLPRRPAAWAASLVFTVYFLFTLVEFYVPLSVDNVSQTPAVYQWLSGQTELVDFDFFGPNGQPGHYSGPLIVAEYPLAGAEELFWVTRHEKAIINLRDYQSAAFGFDAKSFSKTLASPAGLSLARSYGVSYLIYHRDKVSQYSLTSRIDFLGHPDPEAFFRNQLSVAADFGSEIVFAL